MFIEIGEYLPQFKDFAHMLSHLLTTTVGGRDRRRHGNGKQPKARAEPGEDAVEPRAEIGADQPFVGISRRTTFADWVTDVFAFSRQAARSSILKGLGTTGRPTSVPASSLSL